MRNVRTTFPRSSAANAVVNLDAVAVDLSRNQLPTPPPDSVVHAARAATLDLHLYPEVGSDTLIARLARHLQIDRDRVVAGAGSAVLLRDLMHTLCGFHDRIVFASPTFEAYSDFAAQVHATPVPVPLTAGRQDLTRILAEIHRDRDNTRMVIITNPHNPTGSIVDGDEREDFLDAVPSHVTVVFDEAYRDFVTHPGVPDGLRFDPDHPDREPNRPNVVNTRTFSKAFGLGALRVGYLVADPPIADAVRRRMPFSVNRVAQAAAAAALDAAADGAYQTLWAAVRQERDQLRSVLIDLGYPVPASQANFLWLPLGDLAEAFTAHCAKHDVRVYTYPGHGVRISVGSPADNEVFLAAATTFPPLVSVP